ncbi:MAG: hypothetical protein ACK40G_14615 [Cytophagaceae bacterium]
MNSTHWHLMLNHVPLLGMLFGFFIYVSGLIWRSTGLRRAGLITFIVVGIVAIPVYLTGDEAEHVVEHLPGVNESMLEEHEEMGKLGMIFSLGVACLALIGLLKFNAEGKLKTAINMLIIAGSLLTFMWMSGLSYTGGLIRHSEIEGVPNKTSSHANESDHDHEHNGHDHHHDNEEHNH